MLIAMSGVDCSGKTTQLDLLEKWLSGKGLDSRRLWHRPGYSGWLQAIKSAARKLKPTALPTGEMNRERTRIFNKPSVQILWIMMGLTDMFVQYALKVRLLSLLPRPILCDRYIYDACLDMKLRFPKFSRSIERGVAFIAWISPRPHAWFLLTLDSDEITVRSELKKEPFPDPVEMREERFSHYQELSKTGETIVIDASGSAEDVLKKLTDHLSEITGLSAHEN
jgi:thymidylate kinase